MKFDNACIPLGSAWASPFVRWQGPLADINALDLAVDVTRRALDERRIAPTDLSRLVLGWTVVQETGFYGAPTVAARIGAPGISGPMGSQACTTSAVCVELAAAESGFSLVAQQATPVRLSSSTRRTEGIGPPPG